MGARSRYDGSNQVCIVGTPEKFHSAASSFVLDLEVSKGIGVLRNGDDSQEFLQVLLLEVLLGQVLKVSLGEGDLGLDNEVVLVGGDGNSGSEVSGFVFNLNFLGEE